VELPLPDWDLMYRVGAVGTEDEYLDVGRAIASGLRSALPDGWSFDGKDVLDFGAGAGRVLRHFVAEAAGASSFVATDIDRPSIEWLDRNLEPPFSAVAHGELPPLPFAPDSFDLIYASSVFTHLPRSWPEWLGELDRIARRGAYVLLSFQGRRVYELTRGRPLPDAGMVIDNEDAPWDRGGPQVFHTHPWIAEHWGAVFDVELLVAGGLNGYQDLATLRAR
jgi:SAM-dependent methyltransferase